MLHKDFQILNFKIIYNSINKSQKCEYLVKFSSSIYTTFHK